MLNKVNFNNPLLRYRLDPGEPGIPYPSKASMSVARVASHEAGNIMRFRRKAAREGGVVVDTKIYINRKQVGPYLAATSGYSEARIIYPDRRRSAAGQEEIKIPENNLINEIDTENDQKYTADKNLSYHKTDLINYENIDLKIKELEYKERILSSGIENISNKYVSKIDSEKNENYFKHSEVRKVKKEIAYLKMKKSREKQDVAFSDNSLQLLLIRKFINSMYNNNKNYSGSYLINILV